MTSVAYKCWGQKGVGANVHSTDVDVGDEYS